MYSTWNHYNQVHLKGDKKSANKILTDFIVLYKKQERQIQKDFVDEVCTQLLDKGTSHWGRDYEGWFDGDDAPIRIQFPLFKDVLLPELLERDKNNDAQAIRWLGQMERLLRSVLHNRHLREQIFRELETDYNNIDARFFYEKSYEIEKNQRTLDLLLKKLFFDLRDACHEIPCGVLLSPEIMNRVLTDLRKYWEQWEKKNEDDRYSLLLEYEEVAYHWETYYKNPEPYEHGFMDYLIQNSVTTIRWRNSRSCPLPNELYSGKRVDMGVSPLASILGQTPKIVDRRGSMVLFEIESGETCWTRMDGLPENVQKTIKSFDP